MRANSRLLVGLLTLACQGCDANDKVLRPDPTSDGGGVDGSGGGDADDADGYDPDGNDPDGNDPDGNDPDGNDPDGDAQGGDAGSNGVAKDADCDFNGVWIGRQLTRSVALLDGQFANNWYYLEFTQEGENVIVRRHFDCGIVVKGTVTVKLTPETTVALAEHNVQVGRTGTLRKEGSSCVFEMERFWSVRGADEARFVPTGADAQLDIAALRSKNPLPSRDATNGAEDWDDDGALGTAWQVTGIVSGIRNTVQRDWTEWFSDAEHPITPSLDWPDDLLVRARFNNDENVIAPESGLITQLSTADVAAEHTLTLRFLGRSSTDPRVQAIVKDDLFDTCMAIQTAIPTEDGF